MNPIHLLADLWVDDTSLVDTVEPGRTYLREAALAGGAVILHEHWHQFEPSGYSGVLMIAQSHLSIHTWTDEALVAVDVFGCGSIDEEAVLDVLRHRFKPLRENVTRVARGATPIR